MKVVYATRSGNIKKVIEKLGIENALQIIDGNEKVDGEYVIFTYTDGHGITPKIVEEFLKNNPGVKGVVSSGNSIRHAETFNFASENISKEYNVPIIAKLEGVGNEEDIAIIKKFLV